jgi:hypothetical protein
MAIESSGANPHLVRNDQAPASDTAKSDEQIMDVSRTSASFSTPHQLLENLQRQIAMLDSVEADCRLESRQGPPVTAISRILGDSDVFLEHWQKIAGSSSTAAVADVCQWLQSSLAGIVSPTSVTRGLERGRQAVEAASKSGTEMLVRGGPHQMQEIPQQSQDIELEKHSPRLVGPSSAISRVQLSMSIVATIHCRKVCAGCSLSFCDDCDDSCVDCSVLRYVDTLLQPYDGFA